MDKQIIQPIIASAIYEWANSVDLDHMPHATRASVISSFATDVVMRALDDAGYITKNSMRFVAEPYPYGQLEVFDDNGDVKRYRLLVSLAAHNTGTDAPVFCAWKGPIQVGEARSVEEMLERGFIEKIN